MKKSGHGADRVHLLPGDRKNLPFENQITKMRVDVCRSKLLTTKSLFMKRIFLMCTFALAVSGVATTTFAQKTVMVGGAAMYPTKDIVDNAMNSKDHTTLVAAVKAAGLVSTLKSDGPFTVFAPTNEAFDKLPKGTVETLLKPENKGKLTGILTYHVLAGKFDSKAVMTAIKAGGGKVMMKTVAGGQLTFMMKDGSLWVQDAQGGVARITIKDVYQKNGVIHVIDKVLMP